MPLRRLLSAVIQPTRLLGAPLAFGHIDRLAAERFEILPFSHKLRESMRPLLDACFLQLISLICIQYSLYARGDQISLLHMSVTQSDRRSSCQACCPYEHSLCSPATTCRRSRFRFATWPVHEPPLYGPAATYIVRSELTDVLANA